MSENFQILTDALLAALPAHLRLIGSGKYRRSGCPFHGSDHARSLSLNTETGRWHCYACEAKGYTEQAHAEWQKRKDAERAAAGGKASESGGSIWKAKAPKPWERSSGTLRLRPDAADPEPLPAAWLERFTELQARLPEAAAYLKGRRIPLEIVRALGAAVGEFGGATRLILPHTDPQGRIVSLYGRRIDGGPDHKHHHLAGRAKGALNAQASSGAEVWITEGPFDALALMAAGIPNAVAIFGVAGIRWNWLARARRIVLAFDADKAGATAIKEHAKQALMRGAEVLAVTPEELGGAKDIAEAWTAGTLHLAGIQPGTFGLSSDNWAGGLASSGLSTTDDPVRRLRALIAALPDSPPAGLSPSTWADYRAGCNRFMLERGAQALTLGWTLPELFALPPNPARPWNGGALWVAAADAITEVTAAHLRTISRAGNVHTLERRHIEPGNLGPLPWG